MRFKERKSCNRLLLLFAFCSQKRTYSWNSKHFLNFQDLQKVSNPKTSQAYCGGLPPSRFFWGGGRGSKNICTFVQIMRWVVRKFRFFPWKNCLYDWKYHLGQKFCFSKRGWILGGSMYYLYPHYPIPIPVVPMYAHKVTASQFTKFWYLDKNISSVWTLYELQLLA